MSLATASIDTPLGTYALSASEVGLVRGGGGRLVGDAGGVARKRWLPEHEARCAARRPTKSAPQVSRSEPKASEDHRAAQRGEAERRPEPERERSASAKARRGYAAS